MKVLTIRNVPDDLYRVIARLAKRNRRSMQQQVLTTLERASLLDRESSVERAKEIRRRLAGRVLGDTVKEVREKRNR